MPYDVSAHPFAAQAVVDGRVTHGSRDELAATLARDPARVAAVAAAASDRPRGSGQPAAQAAWVRSTVARHVAAAPRSPTTSRRRGCWPRCARSGSGTWPGP